MSNAVKSVIGNDGFSKIENAASHVSELNLTSGRVLDLSADTITTKLLNQGIAGGGTLRQVVGYAPASFATAPINTILFLNNQQKSAVATSASSPQLLLLPVNARVVNILVTNNGVPIVGGTTIDIDTTVWSANPIAPTIASLANAMVVSTINNIVSGVGGGVSVGSLLGDESHVALGGIGVAFATAPAVGANTGVTVQILGAATNNITGDLAVTITYLL